MKFNLGIVFIFLLSSCSIKNYNSIENLKELHNHQNPDKLIFLNKKNFNPSKKIFKKINGKITNDFVYIFSWVNHLPIAGTKHFKALIYDKNSKEVFYVNNTFEDSKTILFSKNVKNFKEEKLILKCYNNGIIDSLLILKPRFVSSEIGASYYIFDSNEKKVYFLSNFTLVGDN
ncbi:hypothetical protein [Flavobacterium lacisediminis]|uniref:Lipoprotein n=1 Tax=Flavobacterium lacisediminis TaxID=2989705 RepID=A0ABT3EGW6_9FLAO|nr:hypothetical protein [Flavobacterium lacisediminis]MCW1147805.1 hypothetical protein [Flavobacterium lacisediminis]